MAEHHASVEADEQIDLDGDNDIEDMMDDEDAVDEDRYRKLRDEYKEDDTYRDASNEYADNDSCRRVKDEYTEDNSCRKVRDEYADDDNYRKVRDEYAEDESYRKVRDEYAEDSSYRKARDEYTEEQPGSDDDGSNKVAASDEANKASSSLTNVENPVVSKNEDDSEKRAELLSLPPHGSEVFIGGLPRDVTEEHLRELCEPFGEIFEVRLMKNKDTKENKGFAFVTFTTREAAQQAIEGIQDKEFKGRTLRCSLSQVKHRLFIGNVPKGLTEEELKNILENSGPGVENIECFKDPQNPSRNRGFLFVEYYNHECAEYAREKMTSSNFKLDGSTPTVSWADPKNSPDSSSAASSQVKAIYLKNLPENVTSEKLKELFECHGEIAKVVLPPAKAGQKRDYGFIHFAERSSALKAIKGTEKYEIDGHVVEATLAKPQADRNHASNSQKPGLLPSYPTYPHGYSGDPYGAYGAGYGGQPMIYGRGPMPPGMRMVPMVLPDGRLGYVLQQPGTQAPSPPSRRSDRSGGHSDNRSRGSDGDRGRRYRPY